MSEPTSSYGQRRFAQEAAITLHHLRRPRYSDDDFVAIAASLEIEVSRVTQHRARFDQAAFWFNAAKPRSGSIPGAGLPRMLDQISRTADKFVAEALELSTAEAQSEEQTPPNEANCGLKAKSDLNLLRRKLGRTAAKLMRLMDVTPETAEDGIPDSELEDALVDTGYADGAAIGEVVSAIADYRQDLTTAIEAAERLATSASSAKSGTAALRESIVIPGHHGQPDINSWIGDMITLYTAITGRTVGTSIRPGTDRNAGQADGPLIRFLAAAGKPLGLEFTPHGWRSRIRTAVKAPSQK